MNSETRERCLPSSVPNIFSRIAANTITAVIGLQAGIWRFDPDREVFTLIGSTERIPADFVLEARLSEADSIAGRVYQTGEMELVSDISSDPRWKYKDRNIEMGFRSAIVTPLKIKGETIGVLDTYFSETDFNESDNEYIEHLTIEEKKEVIQSFASQISTAIRQLEGLEEINQVNQLMSSELEDYDNLLESVTRLSRSVLKCGRVSIFLYDRRSQKLELKAKAGDVGSEYFEPDKGVAGYVYSAKETVLVPDVDQFQQYIETENPRYVIESMIGSPVCLEGEVIGVICADMDREDWFDEFDIEIIETLASQASIAIKNYDLYTRVHLRQKILVEIGNELGGKFYQEEIDILELIFNQALRLDMRNLSIALYDESTQTVSFVLASRDKKRINVQKEGWRSRRNGSGKTEHIIHTRERLLLDTDELKEEWYFSPRPGDKEFKPENYPRAWLGVPMKVDQEVIGVIADYRYDRGYREDDIATLEALAHYAALAIQGMRFYRRQLDKAKENLEKIWGINNLRQIAWMETGLRATRSVSRILVTTRKGIKFATGFLIGSGLLMTNHHVISSVSEANRTRVEFDYQLDFHRELNTTRYRLDPSVFITNAKLDYTIVGVDSECSKVDLGRWGHLEINENADPLPGEYVNIIQHPNGGTKQIVLTANEVTDVERDIINYTTDTMPGSSGSPVFNDLWQVVAIHHSGGDSHRKPFRNQGVLMSAILDDVRRALSSRVDDVEVQQRLSHLIRIGENVQVGGSLSIPGAP
jgi:GAF domain-containing protein/V8-like Glu-specific endopeptidase